jgi:hypothetical protein
VGNRRKYRRNAALGAAALALCLGLPASVSAAQGTTVRDTTARSTAAALSADTANANFNGTWHAVYVDRPDTSATVMVEDEDASTGSFDGTVVPPEGGGALSDGDYDIMDGQVTGDHISFEIERDGIGQRDATYIADWSGTIADNTVSGNIDATLDPPSPFCDDGGDGGDASVIADDDDCLALGGPFTATRATYKLGGEITSGCGGQTVCASGGEPFGSLEVDVDGDNGSATTDTGNDGKWSVDLPAGQYTVTPTDPIYNFTPPDIDVDLKADLGGQDFTACSLPPGGANLARVGSVRRLDNGVASFSLSGEACNERFTYTYSGHKLSVSWTASAVGCEIVVGAKLTDEPLGGWYNAATKGINYTYTKDANKIIVHIVGMSATNPTPPANPVMDVTINPGYRTGTANIRGKSQTRELDITDKKTGVTDSVTCWPNNASISLR